MEPFPGTSTQPEASPILRKQLLPRKSCSPALAQGWRLLGEPLDPPLAHLPLPHLQSVVLA